MANVPYPLEQVEDTILRGLKDFQLATVEHIDSLYRKGQKRVLVSDEVGLGKTLIAKGMIAKVGRLQHEEGDTLFKVVYICSNAAIAGQNLNKLHINKSLDSKAATPTHAARLSMQHLAIFQQEQEALEKKQYIQLIPLTPDTSFNITSGTGTVHERALIFSILRQLSELQGHLPALEELLTDWAAVSWARCAQEYRELVKSCNTASKGNYLRYMHKQIAARIGNPSDASSLLAHLVTHCELIAQKRANAAEGRSLIGKLRVMFARISLDRLEPDFVIMDEFQRFKHLLHPDIETEAGMLANKFFSTNGARILLLSATPYKLYSTLEEIEENKQEDEHYKEFLEVMDFLQGDAGKKATFNNIWSNYSLALRSFSKGDRTIVEVKKNAENAMFETMCRTERISAHTGSDIIDTSAVSDVVPSVADIQTYLQMQELLEEIDCGRRVPVDYVKSCPYLLSFMQGYQVKEHIQKRLKNNPRLTAKANKSALWLKQTDVEKFKVLPPNNARLACVQAEAFEQQAENLLWMPPSCPYYPLTGAFSGKQQFSKMLIFSSWQMVPRMLATMLSYEAERKNISKIAKKYRKTKQEARYFTSEGKGKRYPLAKLNFSVSQNDPRGMVLFCLLYPSKSLADCFSPLDTLNSGLGLEALEKKVGQAIRKLLSPLAVFQGTSARPDARWYYLAPLLMDGQEYARAWLANGAELTRQTETDDDNLEGKNKDGLKGFMRHVEELQRLLKQAFNDENAPLLLGAQPADLIAVLTNMAIASPAVCLYRTYQSVCPGTDVGVMASQVAAVLRNCLNTPEATAVIEANFGKAEEAHWKNVLTYCVQGNLQAVFDEYAHILIEFNGLFGTQDILTSLHTLIIESMHAHTASYVIDTFNALENRIKGGQSRRFNIRSHFAVSFTKSEGRGRGESDRKEAVRKSFNSPFRPFVLATTSIGQEGLDFHYYCRKIVHWNLPSNPIDLEQREGRISRYKCLAIRQNIAQRYGRIFFKKDPWSEMFTEADRRERCEGESELIPYWGLSARDDMIKIERIVPRYAFSRDISSYERLIKILSLYRLTLGQARQEELLEFLLASCDDAEQLKYLFINISPFYRRA